jgi:hypothetical protein
MSQPTSQIILPLPLDLFNEQVIALPGKASPLCVQSVVGRPVVYILVTSGLPDMRVRFVTMESMQQIQYRDDDDLMYLNTVEHEGKQYHVFHGVAK